ncbi:hypothetical protein [Streptomyces sp. NBC_01237]|uniref:hypothetical protein n=1 Tax=Streptomyces sp. NBC_01237 TaxID=2903790 RepID=UPI002DDB6398|nr:hypothetical protein [Streptomyces sp. NBC_01237]WRZ77640.1 hypothetical protein OG251_39165 [Streptomyces sp. NBC_01237]
MSVSTGNDQRGRSSAAHLRALRETACSAVLRRLAGRPVLVARYALVAPGQDAADRLAQSMGVVTREGWVAVVAAYDDTGMTDPATRPHLARLCTAIRRGELHGIVAPSRTDISTFHSAYEDALDTIRTCGGFLALARDETTL